MGDASNGVPSAEEHARRLAWVDECAARVDGGSRGLPLRCRCCDCKTLDARAEFEICEVCFWEDGGQDEGDLDQRRGGPNGSLSLRQARANYLRFGACDTSFVGNVRLPRLDELSEEAEQRGRVISKVMLQERHHMDYRNAFDAVTADPRYRANLDWGVARPGHPEGTVRAHLAEIEPNLEVLRPKLTDVEYWKLKLLIHTHDSFKAESTAGVAIADPDSHASLARAFLATYCDDADLLAMVQYHDEPFALYRQVESKGKYNPERFHALLNAIDDWNLFLAFNIIDGCTAGKSREPLYWLFQEVAGKVDSKFTAADIIG